MKRFGEILNIRNRKIAGVAGVAALALGTVAYISQRDGSPDRLNLGNNAIESTCATVDDSAVNNFAELNTQHAPGSLFNAINFGNGENTSEIARGVLGSLQNNVVSIAALDAVRAYQEDDSTAPNDPNIVPDANARLQNAITNPQERIDMCRRVVRALQNAEVVQIGTATASEIVPSLEPGTSKVLGYGLNERTSAGFLFRLPDEVVKSPIIMGIGADGALVVIKTTDSSGANGENDANGGTSNLDLKGASGEQKTDQGSTGTSVAENEDGQSPTGTTTAQNISGQAPSGSTSSNGTNNTGTGTGTGAANNGGGSSSGNNTGTTGSGTGNGGNGNGNGNGGGGNGGGTTPTSGPGGGETTTTARSTTTTKPEVTTTTAGPTTTSTAPPDTRPKGTTPSCKPEENPRCI